MKIGIIGSGNVGSGLGKVWAAKGHDVVYGVRDPQSDKAKAAIADTQGARAMSMADAADYGEVVVIATPWAATEQTLQGLADRLRGKVVIDCTNPFGATLATSAGEMVAGWLPGAKVVKAFNTIGANNFADPQFGNLRADTYICGDDEAARQVVSQLAEAIGFDVVDCGPISNAGLLEHLTMLWVTLARSGYGREIAFKLLRK